MFTCGPALFGSSGDRDPYWSYVVGLLHFDGPNGSTTFTDETGAIWTLGGTASISTTHYEYGGASGQFTSADGRIYQTSPTGYDFGTNDFTIEGWIYPYTLPPAGHYRTMISKDDVTAATRGWLFLINGDSSQKISFAFRDGSTAYSVISSSAPTVSVWTAVAAVRHGTNLYLFVNGVLEATTVVGSAAVNTTSAELLISAFQNGGAYEPNSVWNGWLDEWRITNGVARYTANYTPVGPFPNS